MKQSERLTPIINYNQTREQDAAKVMGECRQRLDEQHRRLAELEEYCADYVKRFQAGQAMSMSDYNNFQGFLANLNNAIEQQKMMIEQVNKEFEIKKQVWMAAHSKTRSMGRLQGRYQSREVQQEEKRQQRENDDRAGRKPGKH